MIIYKRYLIKFKCFKSILSTGKINEKWKKWEDLREKNNRLLWKSRHNSMDHSMETHEQKTSLFCLIWKILMKKQTCTCVLVNLVLIR